MLKTETGKLEDIIQTPSKVHYGKNPDGWLKREYGHYHKRHA